jgi:hypothetical protein
MRRIEVVTDRGLMFTTGGLLSADVDTAALAIHFIRRNSCLFTEQSFHIGRSGERWLGAVCYVISDRWLRERLG